MNSNIDKFGYTDIHSLYIWGRFKIDTLKNVTIIKKINPIDIFIKYMSADELDKRLINITFQVRNDRTSKALELIRIITKEDESIRDNQYIIHIHHHPRRNLFVPFQMARSTKLDDLTSTRAIHT